MSNPIMNEPDPQLEKWMHKGAKKDQRVDHFFRRTLHFMERAIAVIALVGLAAELGFECYRMFTQAEYWGDINHLLHNLLGIVVGMEFVRMLIETTPANIIEVLVLAITRHVVLSHEDPLTNLVSIVCIAGLFAIRRFLIRPNELWEDMVDEE